MNAISRYRRGALGAFFVALAVIGVTATAHAQFPGTSPQRVTLGGTGRATLTTNNIILGNGTSPVNFLAPGASGNCVTSNGSTWLSTVCLGSGSVVGTLPITASVSGGVATIGLNNDSSLTVSGGNLGLNLSHSNTFTAPQSVNLNTTALSGSLTGSIFNLAQADGVTARLQLSAFGALPAFTGASFGGTLASPAAVSSGTELVSLNAWAYNGASLVGPIASFRSYAAENIASGHQGGKACIATTAIAGTTLTDSLCQQNDGGITVGSPTGGSKGSASINATTLWQAGVQVATLSGAETLTNKTLASPTLSGTVSGAATIPNSVLVNATITVNGTTCTLGASCSPTAAASSIVVGTTTITGGSTGRVPYDNAGTLGEYTITGSAGSVVLSTAPTVSGGSFTALTALAMRDTSAAFDVTLAATSSTTLTAGRTLTLDLVNGARTLKLGSNVTIASDPGTVTGALKSNGSGTFAQAACGNLSDGATGCSTATGTSGATIPVLNASATISGVWSFNSGDHKLNGATSGSLDVRCAAVCGTSTLTLPGGTTDFSSTGGSNQFVKQTSAGGAFTVATIAAADLPVASSSAFGGAKCDNVTITCSGGTFVAVGAASTSIAVGTTTISGGSSGFILYNNAGVLGNFDPAPITNSIASDVTLSNTSNYFDGPSVAQGSTGTWFVSGKVTLHDTTTGVGVFFCKLWDGTTVIDAGATETNGASNNYITVSLSGYLASPAGNLKISCKETTSTAGTIVASISGTGKDSTVTAYRIK